METPTKRTRAKSKTPKSKASRRSPKKPIVKLDEGFEEIAEEQVNLLDVVSSCFMVSLFLFVLVLTLSYFQIFVFDIVKTLTLVGDVE